MTLADQAAITRQDGQVAGKRPGRPARRTFTAAYKARILAAFDALPEGGPERGALLRKERLYHSHIEYWRKQQGTGALTSPAGNAAKGAEPAELARLRAENKKLKARNERLAGELERRASSGVGFGRCPGWLSSRVLLPVRSGW